MSKPTNKCNYCDFTYAHVNHLLDHLNACHTKCGICFDVVFDNDEFDDDFAICSDCRKNESEQWPVDDE